MGQYQQWLQYREQDQQLRTDLAHLEEQQQQLSEQIARLTDTTNVSHNTIIQALLTAHKQPGTTQQIPVAQAQESREPYGEHQPEAEGEKARGTVSPALQAWSQLPDFNSNAMQEPIVTARTQPPVPAGQGPQRSDDTLLPSDISAFVDSHSHTDPQLKVPWWLRNMRSTPEHAQPEQRPVDQQSTRTDQSVQRFFQRWNENEQPATDRPQERSPAPGQHDPQTRQTGRDQKERRR